MLHPVAYASYRILSSKGLVLSILVVSVAGGAFARFTKAATAESFHGQNYYSLGLNLKKEAVLAYPSKPTEPTAYRGPLYPVVIAALLPEGENPFPRRVLYAQALLGSLAILAVYALGSGVHGPLTGALAAAWYAADPRQILHAGSLDIEHFYSLLILGVACGLVEWWRKGDRGSSWRLGLLIGFSLLCRSPLVFFPVLACVAVVIRRTASGEALPLRGLPAPGVSGAGVPPPLATGSGLRGTLAPVLLGAALPLLPWAARNAAHFREFIPLERHAGVCNLYTASQGMIETWLPSEAYALLALEDRTVSAMSMEEKNRALREAALARILRDPIGYLWSTMRRLSRYLRFHPNLWAMALAAFCFLGQTPLAAPLLGLAAYLLAIHSCLSVEERYLAPVMPVLFVLASSAAVSCVQALVRLLLPEAGPGHPMSWKARGSVPFPSLPGRDCPARRDALDRAPAANAIPEAPPARSGFALDRAVLASVGVFSAASAVCVFYLASEVHRTGIGGRALGGTNVEVVFPAPIMGPSAAQVAVFHNDRGIQRFLRGDTAGAAADLGTAAVLFPGYAEPRLSLAAILSRQGRHAEALRICEQALRLTEPPSDDDFLDMAGHDYGRNRLALYASAFDCCASELDALGRKKKARAMSMAAVRVRVRVAESLR
ncbi:MAG: hypothetical protein HY748_03205 [Elusimicrobia bacterium]|nr:hypothetical protein [Elusimicrobiota bacterium]